MPSIRLIPSLICSFLLCYSGVLWSQGTGNAQKAGKQHVTQQSVSGPDSLKYKLEYKGLFSAFIWTSLADVVFSSARETSPFQDVAGCHLRMRLSTEGYEVEKIYPYRYEWRSVVSPDLGKVYLVEEISGGVKEAHNAAWLNWPGGEINFYRKRNRIEPDVFAEDEDVEDGLVFDADPRLQEVIWEKDGARPVPDFLNRQPLLDGKYTYLIYDKSVKLAKDLRLTDPLGLLFAARWADYNRSSRQVVPISYKDDIRQYRIEKVGKEAVQIGTRTIPALKIKLLRDNEEEAEDEGYVAIWLSGDARRLPLQYDIDVVLGRIRLKLLEQSLKQTGRVQTCLDTASLHQRSARNGKTAASE
ncbi:MAG TPA: DUF3108 domain-containing protein [Chromatiales bacterium]|nr:DUF3108 domain-containing protein [Chromatiales bacterium]